VSALLLASCGGSHAARAVPVAKSVYTCGGKISPDLATRMARAEPGARIGVVVDFINKPRARDLLWIGLADCLGQPNPGEGAGAWSGSMSWNAYAQENPWDGAGATCVGWGSTAQIDRWCRDHSVRGIEVW
jgi:hypothetical protein